MDLNSLRRINNVPKEPDISPYKPMTIKEGASIKMLNDTHIYSSNKIFKDSKTFPTCPKCHEDGVIEIFEDNSVSCVLCESDLTEYDLARRIENNLFEIVPHMKETFATGNKIIFYDEKVSNTRVQQVLEFEDNIYPVRKTITTIRKSKSKVHTMISKPEPITIDSALDIVAGAEILKEKRDKHNEKYVLIQF